MKYVLLILRAAAVALVTFLLMSVLWMHRWFVRDREAAGFLYRRMWARCSCAILGIHVETGHLPDEFVHGLYVSNHRSLTDPIVQIMFFDAFIIAKSEVSHIPIIGQGAAMTGIVFVERSKMNSRVAARIQTKELLKAGKNVLVYPEGTTTTEKITDGFRKGTYNAASEAKVPVIPVAIEYRDEKDFWHSGSMSKQMLRQIGAWKTYVRLSIGDPIDSHDVEFSMGASKKWIDAQMQNLQKKWSRVFTQPA